jgi:uncharacterized membrane protein YphA (DoxX/SURF4 family)
MNIALWVIQVLLGAFFMLAGVMKFVTPMEQMRAAMKVPIPGSLLLLGGLGLILPSLLKIKPMLTPLAALGLFVIMVGAVGITVAGGDFAPAIFPLAVGLICLFIAYGRWKLKPIS